MGRNSKAYAAYLMISYIIFGTIGLFVKFIPLPSAVIAAFRGICGALFIYIFMVITKKRIEAREIKSNALWLSFSGFAIGFNWIFLFEAYRYTSIATATLCYYMAPVFVMVAAPFVLKEKTSIKNIVCIIIAVLGMVLVSGASFGYKKELLGVLFGLAAAVLYAFVIICNKKMGEIAAETRALSQLLIAGVTVLPYTLLTVKADALSADLRTIVFLIIIGIVHTGFAYVLNLGTVAKVPAGTVAVLSYTDPVVAILLEAVVLVTLPSLSVIAGAVLILGATAAASIEVRHKATDNRH